MAATCSFLFGSNLQGHPNPPPQRHPALASPVALPPEPSALDYWKPPHLVLLLSSMIWVPSRHQRDPHLDPITPSHNPPRGVPIPSEKSQVVTVAARPQSSRPFLTGCLLSSHAATSHPALPLRPPWTSYWASGPFHMLLLRLEVSPVVTSFLHGLLCHPLRG